MGNCVAPNRTHPVDAKKSKHQEMDNKSVSNTHISSWLNETFGTPTSEETELANLINEYRKEKGLSAISLSANLTKVAQIHARDIVENNPDANGGNMHSWSDKGNWKPCKYTDDNKQAGLMWSKPSELTSYWGSGYEIAYGYAGEARKTQKVDPKMVLDDWKKTSIHNNIIIEEDVWKGKNFKGLGVSIYKGFACAWFGIEPDKTL